jgi:hypothetical protein
MLQKDLERLNDLELELKEKNKRVQQLEEMVNQKNEQLAEYRDTVKNLRAWEYFAGFLLDNKEGEEITEENLQFWLAESEKKRSQNETYIIDESNNIFNGKPIADFFSKHAVVNTVEVK